VEDEQLLDICLKVTGAFEGGTPRYDAVTGNFDGQGMSIGILQWNMGQGTLQKLLGEIGASMGWIKARAFFPLCNIEALALMSPRVGIAYAIEHFLHVGNNRVLSLLSSIAWKLFLNTPESIAAQRAYATSTVLRSAHLLARRFVPEAANSTRVIAFFFDVVTQEGSMRTVEPIEGPASSGPALYYAATENLACTERWRSVVGTDLLAQKLLYYAYERAKLGNPEYMWDALARRGTIATRVGIVHETPIDLTGVLD